ncbi:protocadherin Fat 1 [Leptonychotes weddellii]|uniref:Protocadherin Fat 1 n=1 Tax=Leptonychotes weddellii TaxID=9713 RepID=A0A2U3YE70_LEPWE|nr:protocadherin Fat 1 [Leptonychotes weddellii]
MGRPLVLLLLLLLLQHFGDGDGSQTLAQTPLQFTRFQYNVTVHENSAAKTYVGHPVKMGIYLTNPLWELRYKIVSGDNENLFKAEEYILGDFCFLRIRTKGGNTAILNREVKDHYTLVVKAIEKNSNAEARAKVRVQVLDTNDLRPLFSPTSYSVSLPENTAIRTSVARVSATDADIGTNGEFYYSFKDRTDMFAIHPTSGAVVLTGRLDYAETKLYEMEILAVDRGMKLYGSSGISSLAKLTVHVEQANRCAPVITAVTLSPSELDKDPTYAIITVDDCDQGPSGEIASLSIVAGDLLQQFRTVRSSPGSKEYKVKAVGAIDWDSHPFGYSLTLQAKDKGTPPQFSSVKVIRVTSPQFKAGPVKFEKDVYRAEISEFAPSSTPVVMVKATPSYSHLRYVFKSTPGKAKFSLNHNTGLISILEPVKRQQASHFELEVTTSDRIASTRVLVKVLSANSNPPEFTQTAYKASFDENVPIGTTVMSATAIDPDEGENGYVTYSIANLNHVPFVINHFTGAVSTSEDLDYELMPRVYTLRIRASDWGLPYRREVEVLATVTLNNLNDNTPLFEKINCEGTIPRDLGVGEQITTVSAIDADELQLVRYQIEAGNELDLFSLNPNSGVLSLKQSLMDGLGTRVSFHSLRITATDGENFATPLYINLTVAATRKPVHLECEETGVAKMLAEKLLQANKLHSQGDVEDVFFDSHSVNAHAPQFRSTLPTGMEVKENHPVGSNIIFMNATDLDTGFNGKLVYAISGGNEDSCFIIDMETGMLKILSPLDRETTDKYTLNITVSDLGIPQKAAWRLLDIRVLDANDNPPEFLQESYFVEVSEDKEINSEIIQVEATDKDLGPNGHVTYSILTDTDKFSIDSVTGVVKIGYPLDREVQHVHYLKIEARDQAREEPQLLSTVLLKVSLEDVNDNPPKFIPPNYRVKVREDLPEGTIIMWLEAYDPDLGQSSQVRYSLLDHGEGHFDVDKLSGAVRIVQHLDFEKKQVYNLTVRAKDKGKPVSLSSTCYVEVEVIDVNENLHPPVFSSFVEKGVVKEDVPIGSSVMTVSAHDEDTGRDGEVRYSIRDGSGVGVFKIDEETGVLETSERLDRESTSHYWLTVYAADRGVVPLSSFIEIYIEVEDVNDNAPQTSEPVYYPEIIENSPKDVSVVQIEAFDPDSSSNDKLMYKITSGNPQGFFSIHPKTGSDPLLVFIKVIDTNDHRPQFSASKYEVVIPEDTVPETEILQISAMDKDEKNKLIYTLQSSIDPLSLKKFRLDPATGSLYTSQTLDHEANHQHVLTVMVRDQDVPVKRNYARIVVHVSDTNDHAPWFTSSSYEGRVYESAAVGSVVLQVTALDKDKGKNAEVLYSIESGNIGNSFTIDPILGSIKTAKELDRSSQVEYDLMVKATDQGNPPMSEIASVHIFVTIADNASPKFTSKEYSVEISETVGIGSFVGMVTAHSQSSVVYEIKDGNVADAFDINPHSGSIITQKAVDFETLPIYTLIIQGTNMAGLSTNTTVLVHLQDENDNLPVFMQAEYTGLVSESASINSVVLTDKNVPLVIRATDADKESNALLVYHIVEPSVRKYFAIDSSTGAIHTVLSLDYEETSSFHFTVQVHDMGTPRLFAEYAANVTIRVIDINDCPPVFSRSLYEASLLLPTYRGVKVITVNATDADSSAFSQLMYSITEGNIGEKFFTDPQTGTITVQNTTQLRSRYELTVRASDGRFVSFTSVKINVKESKESQLKFTQDFYSAVVKENSTEARTLAVITAIGNPINEPLFYQILNPDRRFKISRTSGVLSTTGIPFDREQQEAFDVVVEVTQEQKPSAVAHVVVKVIIEDQNDNAPVFVNLPYYAVVKVDTVVGHVIRYVTAVDRDSGRNGEVHYYLKEHHEHFQIGSSGEISLKKQFEPDTLNKEYLITVVAKDGGNPAFSAEVIVPITVMNKAMPVFEKPFYSAEVPENIQMHSPVVHIQANSPEGLKVFYSITDGDPFSQFTINFNTGVINVIAPLDFESHPAYKLSIRATDSLTGAHAEVFVDIIVEDINDNPPVFVQQSYATTLSEASVIGTSVVQVRATDSDSEPNRGISYHMFGNHSKSHDHFHIDSSTGLISLVRTLDYEQFQQHKVFVRAVDGGMPPLSSDVIVTVDVTDLNDNPPLFDQQIYEARISEQAVHGHFVTCVKAYDADSSDIDKLDYSILSGNNHKNFVIDSDTGIITLSNLRRHTLKPFYSLNISVSDGVFRSSAQVHITVIGSNLHSPVFLQSEYEVELAENAPLHTLVIEVKATDGDSGIYGHITYHIVNDFAKDRFYTNERGQIFTLEKLDRETPAEKVISVRLMAKDAGGKVAFCTVNVILTDDNDNAPQFRATKYEVDIGSSAPKGTSVTKVLASDADEGSNADVMYAIEADSESVKENLEINKMSGVITTRESLIGLENEFFTFFVRAVDSGSPSKESVVPVYVKILPPEIQLPKFSEPFYTYTVSEDMPIGTEIDLIRAEHGGTVLYSLIKGNTPESNRDEFFVIDRQSGRLKLEKSLDHETTKWYQFSVLARCTHDDYEVVASVDVSIQVKDANDNSPVLESNPYEAFIVENLPGGSRVLQIRASDLDSGTNGQVMYSLDQSQSVEVIESFAINVETGWITTLKELDHEKRDNYQIQVVASDHGEKVQLSSTAIVAVTVTDVNDSPPRFTAEIYKGTVSEDDPPGGVIAILSTTDADSEEMNRQVKYYITGGDPLGQFAIENIQNEWKVYVKKPLDREKRDSYLLTITATDGTFSSKAIVEVKVLDANDNSPVCEKTLYSDTIPEDAFPGKLIMQVSATDADIRSNAEITYTLFGPGAEKFKLNPDTGELKTSAPLDREEQAVYNLLVKATDGGGRFCQADLVLTLEDVNDNAPEFSADPHTITVFENTEPGTLLTRVQATDADAGLNRKISYSLINSADGQFSINELSGIIQLEKPLDREQQAVYTLTLKAVDQGLPRRLTATGTVVVSVLDINDNPPVFEYREYGAAVSEDILIGTEVLQVYAASRDIEANAEITYSIISGNEHGKFSIDSKTGAIFILENLDYESSHEYYLTVEATDGGSPSLSDVATVSINVTDINDNSPVFSQDTYTAVVSEDAPLEQSVITVMADDADGPSNSHIRYSITDGNQGSPFTIDPTRGEVKVTKLLDRETISGYTLTVQASDNGSPPRVNTTTVNIDVSDVNDNAPVFSKGNYSVIIQENKPVGFSVLQLVVTDKDSSHNGPPFFFTVVSGNDHGAFEVNQQGVLLTSADIKRKVKDHYLLHVKVADNGKPPLSSLTYIDIRVIEESIYPPAILPLEIFITAFGEEYSGGVIGKIHATDQDVYDTLSYSLDPQMDKLFSVSSTGGKLIAHKKLDVGQYLLNVSVTDGKFTTVADVTVHIRQITQEMLNQTIAIRFANLTPEEFVGDYWRNFQRALRNVLGVRRNDIQIVSLQPSEPHPHLDVLLFVEKSGSAPVSTKQLLHKINSSVTDIEEIIGVRILDVFQKLCAGLDCPWKFCDEKVTVDENVMSTHSTARLSFVTPHHHRTAVCLCKEGRCPLVHHRCEDSPCPEGSECVSDPRDDRYTCVCPGGRFGQCPGSSSVTFTGNSFVKYRLMENENKLEMKLTMRLRTYSAHAVVMYARGTDYSILEIHNGRLQYKFDCGSGPGIVSVQSIQVNDGLWHAVSLEVNGNYARLVLDQVHTASGTAPGTLKTLNLDNHVFFGGHIRQQGTRHGRSPQVGNGFRGCMDSIYLNGQELPLNNKPRSHAHIEEWVDVSPGCLLTATEDCSSDPCQNGGICHPSPPGGYYCKCSALYIGTYCELSVNPCSSNPCLYGGTCIVDNGDFLCQCRGLYTGQRCQLSPYCKDEPCKNGGTCFDSLDGAVCQCDSGFRGERCQSDVDECATSPCRNGALCENTHGSYHCNCSQEYKGRHCEDASPNQYVSTPWNIGLAEGIGILVFVTGIFLLVVVFVLCRKMISRKKKQQAEPEDKHLGPSTAFLQRPYFDAKLNKNVYSDIPPQVPVRPISYTPSIPSDSRNNLDRNSFEGSAIPEHPEFSTFNPESVHGHRKAVAVCSVAPNLPPPPPSNSPSDSDSIQKPSWDFDYDTKVVDLDPCLSKKPLEEKPSHPYSARESLSEVQSLSSFQSESCDDNGYHWDTSDWMPSVPLPDIQEFPNYEVIDEQTPLYSADPNAIDTDYYPGGYDIESDFPPPPEDFPVPDELPPLPPEFSDQFESIHPPRDMPAAGSLGSSSRNRQRFHLNQYLPNFYPVDMSEPQKTGPGENSTCREPYAPYPPGYPRNFEAPPVENMPMSVYTSTASCSDVSACCEAESEVMMSDYESGDDGHFEEVTVPPLDAQQHTQV